MSLAATDTVWIALSAIATFALAIATAAFTFAAFRQLPLMRRSQQEAARAADAAARSAEISEATLVATRKAATEQSIAATFPMVDVRIEPGDAVVEIEIANRGAAPALDVSLLVLIAISEIDQPVAQHLDPGLIAQHPSILDTKRDNEWWFLFDLLSYSSIPTRRKIRAQVPTPLPTNHIHILLQCRDVLARNYARFDWYFRSKEGGGRFNFAGSDRGHTARSPRLWFNFVSSDDSQGLVRIVESDPEDVQVPPPLLESIERNCQGRMISVHHLDGRRLENEDRGIWGDA